MTVINPPAFMQSRTDHAAITHRRNTMLLTDGATLGATVARGGVNLTYGGGMAVTGSGSIMQVTVASGLVGIPHSQAFNGVYAACNDGNVNLAVTAAHATQYRRDLVIAEVLDTTDGDGSSEWQLRVVQGSNSASNPAPLPSQPAKSELLAIINVDPAITNLTGKVVDSRRAMPTAGSALYVSSTAQNPSNPRKGLLLFNNQFTNLTYWTGTKYAFLGDAGWISYTPAVSNFGTGTFTTRAARYKWIAEKTVMIHIAIVMNNQGSGSANIAVGVPEIPNRVISEQNLTGRFDDGFNSWYVGVGTIMNTGSGGWIDRIRFPTDGTADLDSLRGMDMTAGSSFFLSGIYEVA